MKEHDAASHDSSVPIVKQRSQNSSTGRQTQPTYAVISVDDICHQVDLIQYPPNGNQFYSIPIVEDFLNCFIFKALLHSHAFDSFCAGCESRSATYKASNRKKSQKVNFKFEPAENKAVRQDMPEIDCDFMMQVAVMSDEQPADKDFKNRMKSIVKIVCKFNTLIKFVDDYVIEAIGSSASQMKERVLISVSNTAVPDDITPKFPQ
ncbi:hypothetical protein PHYBLDRAFT_176213 [Phycomyces blakesleeanus NRRL 1555(-)]|uniref:Uncharacterized protein n=1 Tax=Phycomyces blakesleeanus (strain ATCC 8743b / DSM 1359 / FGSC 10004 / NBRC 33097 / NRRL 1555) TaxID=763407 RepID=A0A162W896_PHYB8|nr:hypothetical protein PHYBLDRAFT_176213 [Phycomyces blakesleeanus NRRL 1555(-)]OAD65295.1 hypothetical protein PHYBLDRAFT_176213 [Phycomyces blakesleeanus NRRL 1555(-)]|eukprot:XP_018283335.1 hypothetical protein PHYBLDRAFT_176213 [Phycomyces blakesleeanus NRRL 1555(-)]